MYPANFQYDGYTYVSVGQAFVHQGALACGTPQLAQRALMTTDPYMVKKIGKDIYDMRMHDFVHLLTLNNPQIVIAVASPDGQIEIQQELDKLNLEKGNDYWFFA